MLLCHLPLPSIALLPSVVVNVIDAAVALTVPPLPLEAGVAATFVVNVVVSDTSTRGVDITTPAPLKTSTTLLLLFAGLPLSACIFVVVLVNMEEEEALLLLFFVVVEEEEEEFMGEPSMFVVTSRRFRFGSLSWKEKNINNFLKITYYTYLHKYSLNPVFCDT